MKITIGLPGLLPRAEADVPFFFNQCGGRNKNAIGRMLDGHEWNDGPMARAGYCRLAAALTP